MVVRNATSRIPSLAGAVKGADIVDLARRVGQDPVDIQITMTATPYGVARHGLGRRYVGGIVIGASVYHLSNMTVIMPDYADAYLLTLGFTPATHVYVDTGTNYTGVVTVRVF